MDHVYAGIDVSAKKLQVAAHEEFETDNNPQAHQRLIWRLVRRGPVRVCKWATITLVYSGSRWIT